MRSACNLDAETPWNVPEVGITVPSHFKYPAGAAFPAATKNTAPRGGSALHVTPEVVELSATKLVPSLPTVSYVAELFAIATRISPLLSQSILDINEP